MNRTTLIALGLGLALAGALTLFFRVSSSERVSAAPPGPDATPVEPQPVGRRELAVLPDGAPPQRAAEMASAGARRAQVSGEGLGAVDVVLSLVELGSDRPVADAEVWWSWTADEHEPMPWDLDETDAFPEGASRRSSDAAGTVRFSVPRGVTIFAVARRDELWGRAQLEPPDEEGASSRAHRLTLAPDWDLVVSVRDAADRPLAGIQVVLTKAEERWRSTTKRRETEAGGTCTFPHVGYRIATGAENAWSVAPDRIVGAELREELGPERPPGPILFRLPPLGEVEALVREVDGLAVPDGTDVGLGIVRSGEPRNLSPFSHLSRRRTSAETVAGTALFRHVVLGQELEAVASRAGSAIETRAYGRGPVVAGERATLEVRVGQDQPVLLLRAVDGAGRPLAGAGLELCFSLRSTFTSYQWTQSVETDADGLFRVDATRHFGEDEKVHLLARIFAGEDELLGQLDIPGGFGPGQNDLGDIVLAPPPVLAAGRVEDSSGAPVTGASIEVEVKLAVDDEDHQRFDWDTGEVRTDERGAFEIRSLTSGEELLLTARLDGQRAASVRTSVGETGIVLVIFESGEIEGSVLLDPEIPADEIGVELEREDLPPGQIDPENHGTNPDEQGAFSFHHLLPGSYRLDVKPRSAESVVSFDGVRVTGGAVCRDPRLQRIDLRGKLFAHHLVLVTPTEDADVQGNLTHCLAGSDGEGRGRRWFAERELTLVAPHEVIDVELSARGFRGVRLEDVRGYRVVALREGLPVRLILRTPVELPEPPIYVKAVLVPADGESHVGIDWGAPCFDEAREIRTMAFAAGRMRVQWVLERRSGAGALATTADAQPEQFVEVRDVPGEQRFEIEISSEELARIAAGI